MIFLNLEKKNKFFFVFLWSEVFLDKVLVFFVIESYDVEILYFFLDGVSYIGLEILEVKIVIGGGDV